MEASKEYRTRKRQLLLYGIFAIVTLVFCAIAFYISLVALGFGVLYSGVAVSSVHRPIVLVAIILIVIAMIGFLPLASAWIHNTKQQ